MSESYKHFRDGDGEGLQPVLVDEDGNIITLDSQACKARSGNLRCTLDKVHQILKTKHLARTPEGQLVTF